MDNIIATPTKFICDTQSCVFVGGDVENHIHAFMTRDRTTSWKIGIRVAGELFFRNAIVDDYGTIVIV